MKCSVLDVSLNSLLNILVTVSGTLCINLKSGVEPEV